jgi:hypothetical protein
VSWKEVTLALAAFAFALLGMELVFRMLSPVALGYRYENGVFTRPYEFELYARFNRFGSHDIVCCCSATPSSRVSPCRSPRRSRGGWTII